MSIALVQGPKDAGSASASSVSNAYSSNVGAGNFLICGVTWAFANGDSISSVKVGSTSFTAAATGTLTNGVAAGAVYYLPNATAGATTVIVTFNRAVSQPEITIYEFSGVATSSPEDGSGASATGSSTTPASGNFTTTNASDLLFSFSAPQNSNTAGTAGWTFHETTQDNAGVEFQIVSSTGTFNATYTQNATGTWTASIDAFKAAGGTVALGNITTGAHSGLSPAKIQTLIGNSNIVGAHSGLSTAKLNTLIGNSNTVGAHAGLSSVNLLSAMFLTDSMGAHAGLGTVKIQTAIASQTVGAHAGLSSITLSGGNQPPPPGTSPYSFWGGGHL